MPSTFTSTPEISVPLCVDLDGTLIRSDVLWESMLLLLKRNPFYLLALPVWLLRGRAAMKKEIAARTELNPANLPYHCEFLEYLKSERAHGRVLILATAADEHQAKTVARHVGLFSDVIASNGQTNVRGKNKGHALAARYGRKGFDYAGNSSVDLPVWQEARRALVVNADERLAQRARGLAEVSHVFNEPHSIARAFVQSLRPLQWAKNIVIFVPLITSHNFDEPSLFRNTILAFIAFNLCVSGLYVLNDLRRIDSDRQLAANGKGHFASGRLPLPYGLFTVPVTLATSIAIGILLSWKFVAVLAVYFLLGVGRCSPVKSVAFLDVTWRTAFYMIPMIAGLVVTRVHYSWGMLTLALCVFLGLALIARYATSKSPRE